MNSEMAKIMEVVCLLMVMGLRYGHGHKWQNRGRDYLKGTRYLESTITEYQSLRIMTRVMVEKFAMR